MPTTTNTTTTTDAARKAALRKARRAADARFNLACEKLAAAIKANVPADTQRAYDEVGNALAACNALGLY